MERELGFKLNLQLFGEVEKTDGEEGGKSNSPTVEGLLNEINAMKINTVSKEEYDKILNDNAKLIKEVTNNRAVVVNEPAKVTREDIVKRCEERTLSMGDGTSYESIKSLIENYDDMITLGMDVSLVDESVVNQLRGFVKEANGDPVFFKSIMEARVKSK